MTSLIPSSRLEGLPGYGRGRATDALAFRHRLGSNECDAPPSADVIAAAYTSLAGANRYPDLRGETLSAELARRFGLDATEVAVSAGSVVLLEQLVRAYCDLGDEVVSGWRSYEAYPIIVGGAGATLVEAPLDEHHRIDPKTILAAIGPATRAVILCNPNNPTGTALAPDTLNRLIEAIPPDVLVIVDEAYAEFNSAATRQASAGLARRGNVAVLRTFSKAWGLAGMRIGYCLADPAIVGALQAVQPPFPLPAPAIAMAVAALGDEAGLRRRVTQAQVQRTTMIEELRAIGLPVAESAANFIWLPLDEDAEDLSRQFQDHGIAVRCFAGAGVRITTGTETDTDAVLAAVTQANERLK